MLRGLAITKKQRKGRNPVFIRTKYLLSALYAFHPVFSKMFRKSFQNICL